MHHWHFDLLPAQRVHLQPQDRFQFLQRSLPQMQVAKHARRQLPHKSSPQQQLVPHHFRRRRRLPQRFIHQSTHLHNQYPNPQISQISQIFLTFPKLLCLCSL
jgi:hypothetical protein